LIFFGKNEEAKNRKKYFKKLMEGLEHLRKFGEILEKNLKKFFKLKNN